ncbi:hypothetical protein HYH02_007302 [Chlamydomonas schloesseri]|uniref:Uncharacterized protein n=1 Tax=Chlamydomonas schloesseri TaxID=2026947 RepID=A0A836B4Z6_9CHLO|nr:hypothetical protein HYH02_007302 [Chlamydomonas schloesseri]|eukprot:KAG2447846.1 hypothetical protein HYH02_007302 [Chlamydomonas schloesseri]
MELQEMQEQLQRKAEELQRAEAESLRLRQRLKLLETVLPVREQQIRLLQLEGTLPGGNIPSARAAQQRLTITELAPSDSDASSLDVGLSSGSGGGSSVAVSSSLAAVAVSVSSDGGRYLVDERGQVVLVPQAPPHGSADEVLRKFMAIWNRDVREAALLLATHDVRPHDPTPAMRLAALQDENWPLLCDMWKHYPSLLTDVCRLNMDTGRVEDPPPGHWEAVVTGLRPTAEQKAACLGALDLYRERMGPALRERKSLARQLSAALEQQADGQRGAAAAAAGRQPAQHHQQLGLAGWGQCGAGAGASGGGASGSKDVTFEFMSAAQSLQRNLDLEAKALGIIHDFVGTGVFDVVSMKRISVLSHPYFPDILAVLTAVEDLERRQGGGGASPRPLAT